MTYQEKQKMAMLESTIADLEKRLEYVERELGALKQAAKLKPKRQKEEK